jgi:hypothetical protein
MPSRWQALGRLTGSRPVRRLVVPTMTNDGREVKAGWTGKIIALLTSLAEQRQTGVYEVNLDGERYDENWPLLQLPSAYFECASETRQPGELRQGDRVRLRSAVAAYEAGDVCTVLNTRTRPDGIFHDVLPDFGETLMALPREQLEDIPGCSADVVYAVHGKSVNVSFNDTSFSYGQVR